MLAERLQPCGPVLDKRRAADLLVSLGEAAAEGGWSAPLDAAAGALAPVLAASPYLASLARRYPDALGRMLGAEPEPVFDEILAEAAYAPAEQTLRRAKAELHLLTALCDLGGVWDLDQVTGALTRFADVAVAVALAEVARRE